MLRITPADSEEKKGTCIVCSSQILTKDYWRCLDAVCGAVEGNGRVCGNCYEKVQNKNRCVACNRPLEDNFISDPKLLPAALELHVPVKWTLQTLQRLIIDGEHFDRVSDMSSQSAQVLRCLAIFACAKWHLFPLHRLQRLYATLESAIVYDFAAELAQGWRDTVIEIAVKRSVGFMDTAQWLLEWLDHRGLLRELATISRDDVHDKEAKLLSVCENKQEFKVLRRLITGEPASDVILGYVIDKYLDLPGKGQEWVMQAILSTGAITEDQEKREEVVHRLLTKFPYPEMYQWAQKHRIVLGGPSHEHELALQYNIFPVVYGCHSKGLYAQSASLALKPVFFEDKHGGHGCCTLLPAIHPDVKQRVLYVDLACDSMKLDWHMVHDIKTVDATSKRVTVELCEDGVEIYFDFEQLLFPVNVPLKIVQFTDLRLKQKIGAKRKFLSV